MAPFPTAAAPARPHRRPAGETPRSRPPPTPAAPRRRPSAWPWPHALGPARAGLRAAQGRSPGRPPWPLNQRSSGFRRAGRRGRPHSPPRARRLVRRRSRRCRGAGWRESPPAGPVAAAGARGGGRQGGVRGMSLPEKRRVATPPPDQGEMSRPNPSPQPHCSPP